MGKLTGKVAVVTGSGQGVGRGIALLLAREGAKVVTNNRAPKPKGSLESGFRAPALGGVQPEMVRAEADRFAALAGDAESVAAEILAEGGEAVACYGDITDFEVARQLIDTATGAFGRVDILVNNAAGLGFGPFLGLTEDDWDYQVAAKLKGAFNCMQHAVPRMIEQGYGRILNASSDAWTGMAALSPYSAANAGIVALTKSTAKEMLRYGITVNAFCPQAASPGHISFSATLRTMMAGSGVVIGDPERMRRSEEAHGPAENLTFLAYLASEDAAEISGAVFSVTGGGDISLYSEPTLVAHLHKPNTPWTMEELARVIPSELLANYVSVAKASEF